MGADRDQAGGRTAVAEYFDREAGRFPIVGRGGCRWAKCLIDILFRRSLKLRFERVLDECSPIEGRRVLDVGCGPGAYAVALTGGGAGSVVGIDVSARMIELATQRAREAGVGRKCRFEVADLRDFVSEEPFDYVVVMGVMDYIDDAAEFVAKTLSLTQDKAVFSFPRSGGILAWQRRLRYRRRCPLFLYSEAGLRALFTTVSGFEHRVERVARDLLVVCTRIQGL